MATYLAEQLKKLRVPQTTLLLQEKTKQSLLFDPKEAATLEKDTVYSIGLTGLEELELLNDEFTVFESTLFNEASKHVERAVQTKSDNEKLDHSIKKFLVLVSPYILLRPAQKALEWLVHRFHIHMFNVDQIIACILPFHETKFFIRFLQLLDLSNPSGRWHWLKPLQKPGLPLAKSTLLNHCYTDLNFMKFVCDLVPEAIEFNSKGPQHSLRTTLSFYALTILGSLEYCKEISEEMLTLLLPYLLKGMKSENDDYCCSTYMILSQIVKKTTLKPEVLEKILIKLLQRVHSNQYRECAVCLLVVFQFQKPSISGKLLKTLVKQEDVLHEFVDISQHYNCRSFFQPFIIQLIPGAIGSNKFPKPAYSKALLYILRNITLETVTVEKITKALFKVYSNIEKGEEPKGRTVKFFNHLERRYSVIVDKVVEKLLDTKNSKLTKRIKEVLHLAGSEKHSGKSKDSLYLNICHPNAARRYVGVVSLVKAIKNGKIKKKQFIQETLQLRFNDDNPKIIKTILELDELLLKYFDTDGIFSLIQNILNKNIKTKTGFWSELKGKVFNILCNQEEFYESKELEIKILRFILNFIINKHIDSQAIVKNYILSSKFAESQAYLNSLNMYMKKSDAACSDEDQRQWNLRIISGLIESFEKVDQGTKNKMALLGESKLQENTTEIIPSFVALVALKDTISKSSVEEQIIAAGKALRILKTNIKNVQLKSNESESDPKIEALESLLKNKLPWWILQSTLKAIINMESIAAEGSGNLIELQADTFYFIAEYVTANDSILQKDFQIFLMEFLNIQFKSVEKKFLFLSSFWLEHLKLDIHGEVESRRPNIQSYALNISSQLFVSEKELDWLFKGDNIVTFLLLATLCAPMEDTRKSALKCITTILSHKHKEPSGFQALLQYVKNQEDEIIADENQFPHLLSVWLSQALLDPEAQKEGPTTRKRMSIISHTPESMVLRELLRICNYQISEHCQYGGLLMLEHCNSHEVLVELLYLLNGVLVKYHNVGKLPHVSSLILSKILSKFTVEIANSISRSDTTVFQALDRSLKTQISDLNGVTLPQMAAKIINKRFFAAIPSNDVKLKLLSLVLSACASEKNLDGKSNLLKSLRRICFDGIIISKAFQISDHATEVQSVKEARLSRSISYCPERILSSDLTKELLDSIEWKKVVLLLEAIQDKNELTEGELVIVPLFDLLKRSLELESNPNSEYLKQLILSSLLNCCQKLKIKLDENLLESSVFSAEKFQVELAVQCIRLSPNPQTQNLALILLNLAAVMYPNHVLHNIMAIFTFMGSSLIRQDDSYSFQVITKTIDTIIPALMQTSQTQKDSLKAEEIASAVVQVFADAFPDIPRHRRLPLFSKLVSVLGANKFLWLPLIHLIASRPPITTKIDLLKSDEDKSKNTLPEVVEFAIELSLTQNPAIQISACNKIIQFISTLSVDSKKKLIKKEDSKSNFSMVFGEKKPMEKDIRYFNYMGVSFIASLISSEQFISQIVDLNESQVSKMEAFYTQFLESALKYLQQVAHLTQENSQNNSFRYWKSLQHKLYDLIEKINALLPSNQFVFVIQGLMQHQLPIVGRKAMDMLNSKLLHQPNFFGPDDVRLLIELIKPLTAAAKGKKQDAMEKEDIIINQQTALYGLKLLCKAIGSSQPSSFKKTLEVVIRIISRKKSPPQLISSGFLCLAELCNCLKAHTLPYLNKFMPIIISVLEDSDLVSSNDLLLMSLVTTVHRVVENLSLFLSPYLGSIVKNVCLLSMSNENESQKSNVQQRLKIVRGLLASEVPARVVLPIISVCYQELSVVGNQQLAIVHLVSLLSDSVSRMEKKELAANLLELQTFYIMALDFRKNQPKNLLPRVDAVEGSLIDSLLSFVLKLSETTFRPIFYKVFEWATIEDEFSKDRILTFYRLTSSLAEKLKSLFVLFASHFVTNAAEILQANNNSKADKPYFGNGRKATEKACHLLKYILLTLQRCFLHDNKYLVDKDCFNTLSQPLVDQIENTTGEEDQYEERISKYLSPCLAQFVVAASDDSCWKPFNYQLLLKTRNSSPKVRFAALSVLQEIVEKLGEDYMALLPESIPFLAELMEDESFEVEQQCQAVVSKMEQILGEPLMKYF